MPSKHIAPLLSTLKDLSSFFKGRNIPATLIGGIAASILGRPRLTRNIDAMVIPDNKQWEEQLLASKEYGFVPRLSDPLKFAQANRVFLLRHQPTGIDVDTAI